ncbi:hypothetical protein C414_000420098 [Campylobacter jejuni subsp. jejuni 414]|nr:hypothetical protein C414_000420098 [Campylobacter jejuni subsp. jejuni 414]
MGELVSKNPKEISICPGSLTNIAMAVKIFKELFIWVTVLICLIKNCVEILKNIDSVIIKDILKGVCYENYKSITA